MRRLPFLVLVGLLLTASWGEAYCRYFRVKAKPVSCLPAATTAENLYAVEEDSVSIPSELAEPKAEPGFEVACACTYTLQGADLRCDPEREEEYRVNYPVDPAQSVCSRTKTLCLTICPKTLP